MSRSTGATRLSAALEFHGRARPDAVFLDDTHGVRLTYSGLARAVDARSRQLQGHGAASVGLHCDNGPEWVVTDLATAIRGIPTVPIPVFFSADQIQHVCRTAGVDTLVTDRPEQVEALGYAPLERIQGGNHWIARKKSVAPAPVGLQAAGVQKVTFTSGTTGTPKGVCLGAGHLALVAARLAEATDTPADEVHLCSLPLSILLENVAGVYRILLSGGRVVVPPLHEVGFGAADGFDPTRLWRAMTREAIHSAILVPEVLKGLTRVAEPGAETALRFLGVGGARVAPSLLEAAEERGLPAYEGYGLSEFGSVVALNTPGHNRVGATGRPLPHVRVRVARGGEIEIAGPHTLGYLTPSGLESPDSTSDGYLRTGDRGEFDGDFLRVTGRLRNVLITSFGRNVSPEWIESDLLAHPGVVQAVVYGDGAPCLSAALTVVGNLEDVRRHVESVNQRLPDYARLGRCCFSLVPFSAENGLASASGLPDRSAVVAHFTGRIPANPETTETHEWAFSSSS